MSKYKFRGQDYKGQWHYGCLVIYNNETFAIAENDPTWTDDGFHNDDFGLIEVKPETVGQYSTINDKNDKPIYDGDKIRFYQVQDCSRDVWEDEPEMYIEEITGIVRFQNGIFSVYYDSNEQEDANMPLELLSKDVFPSFANQPIEEAYKYLTNLNEFPFLTDGKDIEVAEIIGNIHENGNLLKK